MKTVPFLVLMLGPSVLGALSAQSITDLDELIFSQGVYLDPSTMTPFSGEVASSWQAGIPKERGTLVNGVWDGSHEWYHVNGQLATLETWENGQLNGPSQSYYRHGGPSVVENYEEGQLHGLYEAYWAWRGLAEQGRWFNGEQCGEWLSFDRIVQYPACPG